MKTFIDRNCFFYTELTHKKFYFIMTAADGNKTAMDKTISEFRGYIQYLSQCTIKNMILATNVWNVGDITQGNILQDTFNMGASI